MAAGALAQGSTSMERNSGPPITPSPKTVMCPVLPGISPPGQHKPSRVKVNGKAGYIHAMTSQDWAVTVLASAGGPQEVRDLGAVDSKDERGLHHLQCS